MRTFSALTRLDTFHADAPAALGLLRELMGPPSPGAPDPRCDEEAETFQAASRWWSYPELHPDLPAFCLREITTPDAFAGSIENRPEYVLTGASHLAHRVASDWPLLLVYRAGEMSWE